jgi:UPF0042 nucleotide-binding protein
VANLKQLVVISGRSGAGKTSAARALEDAGFFVVDNLPPQLVDKLLSLLAKPRSLIEKVALVVDARETIFLNDFPKIWASISSKKYRKELVYLYATEQKLIDRFQETRRRHPLDDGCGTKKALARENEILKPIHSLATSLINTDLLNPHELRNVIREKLTPAEGNTPLVKFISFGFKNGVPSELDFCFDVRFLPNPYYDPAMKHKTGHAADVYKRVINVPEARVFLEKLIDMMQFLYPLAVKEGKSSLTVAVGCTGGQHRSVAIVQALAKHFKGKFAQRVQHRDVARAVKRSGSL